MNNKDLRMEAMLERARAYAGKNEGKLDAFWGLAEAYAAGYKEATHTVERRLIAAMCLQGFCSHNSPGLPKDLVIAAIICADELLTQLNNQQGDAK